MGKFFLINWSKGLGYILVDYIIAKTPVWLFGANATLTNELPFWLLGFGIIGLGYYRTFCKKKAGKHHIKEIERLMSLYKNKATIDNLVKWSGFDKEAVNSAIKEIERNK